MSITELMIVLAVFCFSFVCVFVILFLRKLTNLTKEVTITIKETRETVLLNANKNLEESQILLKDLRENTIPKIDKTIESTNDLTKNITNISNIAVTKTEEISSKLDSALESVEKVMNLTNVVKKTVSTFKKKK